MKKNIQVNPLENLASNHLLPMLDYIGQKVETLDPQYVQTFNYEVQQELEQKINTIQKNDITISTLKDIINEIKKIDFSEVTDNISKFVKNRRELLTQQDYRVELLYDLIEEADKKSPLISFLILNRRPYPIQMEKTIKPLALLNESKTLEGEPRAEKIANFYHDVTERVYDNYVRVIWELCCVIKSKKKIKSFDTFGNTIRNLQKHLPEKYHDLIDFEVSWYRNTTAHKNHRYLPSEKVLLLQGKIGKEYFEEKICANCLQTMAEDIYIMSGLIFFEVFSMYSLKNLQVDSGLFKTSLEMLKKIDLDKPNELDSESNEKELKNLFQHLGEYEIIRRKPE